MTNLIEFYYCQKCNNCICQLAQDVDISEFELDKLRYFGATPAQIQKATEIATASKKRWLAKEKENQVTKLCCG